MGEELRASISFDESVGSGRDVVKSRGDRIRRHWSSDQDGWSESVLPMST